MRCAAIVCLGLLAVSGFVGSWAGDTKSTPTAEEKLLQAAGVGTDDKALLEFFRKRSLTDGEQSKLEKLVEQLNDPGFEPRDQAAVALIQYGKLALPFLKKAQPTGTLEFQRRVDKCLKSIETTAGAPDQPAAAARLLAQRKSAGAAQVLLNYLPFADDEWLEEQVVGVLAELTLSTGKLDPVLDKALKEKNAARKAFAVYLLGQRGGPDWRPLARKLLADDDAAVRVRARAGLLGKQFLDLPLEHQNLDEAQLREAKLTGDPASLIDYLKAKSLSPEQQTEIHAWIKQLNDKLYNRREAATRKLIEYGTPARPYLRDAMNDADPETARRARLALNQINQGQGSALPTAVVRRLGGEVNLGGKTSEAIGALLTFLPFADDDGVVEEAISSLCRLSVREEKTNPLLLAALHDPHATRRAAAAYVLARVGLREQIAATRKLLDDPVPAVRYKTALGLLSAREPRAVGTLLDLYDDAPDGWISQIDDVLYRLAGERTPAGLTADSRAAQAKAWKAWWQEQAAKADLSRLGFEEQRLGLTLIVLYDNNNGMGRGLGGRGQVFECGRDGKPRWTIENLTGPMDAHILPGGRVLVAETQRVTEREISSGRILWEYGINNPQGGGNIVACQRLPGGNTFLATYNEFVEVTPEKKEVYRINRGPGFFVFSAQKTRAGKIVYATAQGSLVVFDPIANKQELTVNLGQAGGWCSAEQLPNGRFLVSMMGLNQVREIDAQGKIHWQATFNGVFRATRLPNGNTLVASMNNFQVAELDRGGQSVWQKNCPGRPWMVRFR